MFTVSVVMNMKKYLKKNWIETLKVLGLTTNVEEYNRIYNLVWEKHKPRI